MNKFVYFTALLALGSTLILAEEKHSANLEKEGNATNLEKDGHANDLMKNGNATNLEKDGQANDLMKEGNVTNLEKDEHANDLMKEGNATNLEKDGQANDLMKEGNATNSEKDGHAKTMEKKDSVNMTLFYESYCPSSIRFIRKKLLVTWFMLRKKINLDLVPYGNAHHSYNETTGQFNFSCEHGPEECEANILHACAIDQACGTGGTLHCPVDKVDKVLDYIFCVIRKKDQRVGSDKCATKAGLDPAVMNSCAGSKQGEQLLLRYGTQTNAYKSDRRYVPYLIINGKHDLAEQGSENLRTLLCQKYIKCWT